jgi:tripartite-type tricarboxylate transporter receptor subunit TctC
MNGRSTLATSCALAMSGFLFANLAIAQEFPNRYVRIITAGAGSFHDIVARRLAQGLAQRWTQAVVVENQPAAGLTIGAGIAARAPADGYTLLLADRTALAAAPALYKNLRYDPSRDFQPLTLVARTPNILVTNARSTPLSLREFIDDAMRQSQPILFAGAGVGTVAHLCGELFKRLANIDMQVVQYKGGVDAAAAVLRNEVKLSCVPISVALPHIQAGNMRALAVASSKRFENASRIPTNIEAGLRGFEAEQWLAMMAPSGLPGAIASRLNQDIQEVMRQPEFEAMVRSQGGEVSPTTPAELAEFIANETARLKELIESTGLQIQ